MKKLFVFITFLFIIGVIFAQTTVFSDDFSTNLSESWTTSGQIGSSSFYVNRSGADWGARRYNNQLELTNDASSSSNAAGWVLAYTSTGGFGSPYNKTLSSNPGIVTWYFNMRQSKTDPGGFGSTSYGVAFILAGTSNTTRDTGTGYAVALGGSGSTDPIRLIKYSSGLGTSTNLITSNTSGLTDFGNEYLSIKVTYDPSNNTWELFLRNDGTTGFSNPMAGTLTTQGTTTDNTYTSSTNLDYMGGYWQGSTGGDSIAFFDNITVMVAGGGTPTNPTISVDPASLTGFSYVTGSGPSSEQSFSLTGSNLTSNLTVSIDSDKHFEISSTSGGSFVHSLTYTPSDGSVSATVYVRMKAGLAPGDYNNENIVCSSEGATSQSVTCSGTVYKPEPANHVTNFICSSATITSLTLTWSDASKYAPDGYLIKGSNVSFDAITAPVDGTPESDATLVKNVAQGTQTCTFSSLSENTTYYFKIYPYTNSGSAINYKTDGNVPQTSGKTLTQQILAAGDIAILGFQSDSPDKFAFIALTNILGGTEIKFTDNGWTVDNNLSSNEGTLTWIVPSAGINKGTIITVEYGTNWTVTQGTISSSGSPAFATAGDQIIVYQGSSSSPTLIYAFSTSPWINTGEISSKTSYLPTGLTNGTTAHCFASTYDNGFYTNTTIIESKASALSSISNDDNWTKSNDTVDFPSWTYQEEQPPLPVVLTSFMAAISNQNYINLTWITQTETGMMGYYIMRNNTNDLATAQIVSPLIPAINSSQPKAYLYTDHEVTQSGTYYYWLQANDMDGTIYILSFVSIEYNVAPGGTTPSIPLVTELNNVYPNPFNPQLFIPFSLANKSEVKIIIYNTRGQVVKDFALGEKNAGNYRIEWDGTDNNGKAVPNGIYCIRMIAGKDYYQTKAILMK